MKKLSSRIAVLGLAAMLTQSAFAAPRVGGNNLWAGLTTDGILGTMSSTAGTAAIPALTALITLSEKTMLQFYFGLSGISPIGIGGGAAFKYNAIGDMNRGMHVGAGLGLGTTGTAPNPFYVNLEPLFGLHVTIAEGLALHADAGLAISITSSGGATIRIGGNSPQLGLSALVKL